MKSLLCILPLLLTSCLVTSHRAPLTLVEMTITGSPRIIPGGPHVYIDDVYRGNPVDGRFRIYLPDGTHTVRIQGAETLWEGDIGVGGMEGIQTFTLKYGDESQVASDR